MAKRYLMYVAAGVGAMMRALFNKGTPRSHQAEEAASACAAWAWIRALTTKLRRLRREFERSVNWLSTVRASTQVLYAA